MNKFRLALSVIILLSISVGAQQVEFNYEGRVLSSGIPYTGPGYFKFAIVDKAGTLTLWSNDETSTTGDEPASAVIADVTDGVFNVIVGDTSGFGMEPLDASLFNVDERVKLRVWFSDSGVADSFEQLNPDRAITNPGLLGAQSYNEIEIFVDPVLGNDKNPGNYNRPKQTIQAAWYALPSLIKEDATIYLRDGVYREEVLLTGKTTIGDATIAIAGNIASPTAVRITGADEGAETTPIRARGIVLKEQKDVLIEGVLIDYTKDYWDEKEIGTHPRGGIVLLDGSTLILRNSIVSDHFIGLYAYKRCDIEIVNCEFKNGVGTIPRLVWINELCFGNIVDSYFHDGYFGITGMCMSAVEIEGCTISDMDQTGCKFNFLCQLSFYLPQTKILNCIASGVESSGNSIVLFANTPEHVYYSGNGSNLTYHTGTETYDP